MPSPRRSPTALHGTGTCPACGRSGLALTSNGYTSRHLPPAGSTAPVDDERGFCLDRTRIVQDQPALVGHGRGQKTGRGHSWRNPKMPL